MHGRISVIQATILFVLHSSSRHPSPVNREAFEKEDSYRGSHELAVEQVSIAMEPILLGVAARDRKVGSLSNRKIQTRLLTLLDDHQR